MIRYTAKIFLIFAFFMGLSLLQRYLFKNIYILLELYEKIIKCPIILEVNTPIGIIRKQFKFWAGIFVTFLNYI